MFRNKIQGRVQFTLELSLRTRKNFKDFEVGFGESAKVREYRNIFMIL